MEEERERADVDTRSEPGIELMVPLDDGRLELHGDWLRAVTSSLPGAAPIALDVSVHQLRRLTLRRSFGQVRIGFGYRSITEVGVGVQHTVAEGAEPQVARLLVALRRCAPGLEVDDRGAVVGHVPQLHSPAAAVRTLFAMPSTA